MNFHHDPVTLPEITRTEIDGVRHYIVPNGECYLSVTSFTGTLATKGIEKWRKQVGEEKATAITRNASERGTNLHDLVERYLKNDLPAIRTLDPILRADFHRVRSTIDRVDRIRIIETPMYSDALRLAGTPDCIAEFDGELSIIDFKTSRKEKKEKWITNYYMQTAAYAIMHLEHFGTLPKQSVIIMATATQPQPQLFIKPMNESMQMLADFIRENKHLLRSKKALDNLG